MGGTAEDRLLLAGLRRLGDHDRTPRGGSGPTSPRKGDDITIISDMCNLLVKWTDGGSWSVASNSEKMFTCQ